MSPASGLPVGTRKHLARYYLTHSAMTTGKIAYLLTYDDTKSSNVPSRTWTRTTPDTVRTAITVAATAGAGR